MANSTNVVSTNINNRKGQTNGYFSKKQQLQRMITLLAVVALIIAQSAIMPSASARYLPTRSNDQFRRQEIKEILRLLLDLPKEDSLPLEQTNWSGGNVGRAIPDNLYDFGSMQVSQHNNQNSNPNVDAGGSILEGEQHPKKLTRY